MTKLRLRKLVRDVVVARVRVAMMIVAIALSIVAVGGFLGARAILAREVVKNYAETKPASATLVIPAGIDLDVLRVARAQPGVIDAAARGSVMSRVQVRGGRWLPLLLFISDPADQRRIVTNRLERGSWPPPPSGFMLERTALSFLGVQPGDRMLVQTPSGQPAEMTLTGVVHDGSLAPAEQERVAYGFATTDALVRLGESAALTELKIVVGTAANPTGNQAYVERVAEQLGGTLASRGRPVISIQVPPPLRHPHQGQMDTVGFLMMTFGVVALLLSSILVATMLGGMLAGQIRQIGAMKAVGARSGQLLGMYLLLTAAIAIVATLIAVIPGALIGRLMATAGGRMLNLDLMSKAIPPWVFVVEVIGGIAVPLLVALVPLMRGSRITVRQAIDDHGVSGGAVKPPGARARLARLRGVDRSLVMAVRNMARRRGRLALTVGLLAVAGGMFETGFNTAAGWTGMVNESVAVRKYDLDVRLNEQQPVERLLQMVAAVPGVRSVEAWGAQPVTVTKPELVDVAHVYPDDAHGSFTLIGLPANSSVISLPLLAGRWLRPNDSDAVVVNNLVGPLQIPGVKIGDQITLSVAGKARALRVVGIASDFGVQSAAYVTDSEYAHLTGKPGLARILRIGTEQHDLSSRIRTLAAVEQALSQNRISMALTLPIDELQSALDRHVIVLADALIAMSLVLAVVGLLGLASTMSTNVTERTREFGILNTIGATPAHIRRIVVTEGLFIGAASVVAATLLALPATAALGRYVGTQAFHLPLPYTWSVPAVGLWAVAALAGAAGASAAAARRAGRLTIRAALDSL